MSGAVLALDLATATGWAFLDDDGCLESGVQRFDLKRGESPGCRFLRFNAWLAERFVEPPRVVAYEQNFRRGGAATEVAAGFSTRVQEACARHGVEHLTVNVSTLKKWATGKGTADKVTMVLEARARFPGQVIEDDNQADALLVLAWVRAELGL